MLRLLDKGAWSCPLGGSSVEGRTASRAAALLRAAGRMSLTYPRAAVLLLLLLLAGAAGGAYAYAVHLTEAARLAIKDGHLDEAKRDLAFCRWLRPRNTAVRLLSARAAWLSGDLAGAEATLQQCLKLEHGATPDIQLEFLLLRIRTGQVDQVEPELMLYVEDHHPDSSLILETIAHAHMNSFRFRPALSALDRWIALAPEERGTAKAYFYRGWVLLQLSYHDEGLADYRHAVELAPDMVDVRLQLAETYLDRNSPLDALPHLEQLMAQHPERADVQAALGRCQFMLGQPEKARPLLEGAVAHLPDDTPLLIHLAKLDMQENRPVEAEQWLRRALQVDPHDMEAENMLAESLRVQGRDHDAKAALENFARDRLLYKRAHELLKGEVARPSGGPQIPYEIGSIFLGLGKERLGLNWLYRALESDPDHRPTHQALAEYYAKKGDQERAAQHAARAGVSLSSGR